MVREAVYELSQKLANRLDLSSALPGLEGMTTLPSRLYAELESAIINGALQPGQRLHADDLATHFGVSRIPVREALSSLDQAGWVEIRPRHGVRVRERSVTELRELFEFRAGVEAQVARWAAERRTDADLVLLDRAVASTRAAVTAHADYQGARFIGFREVLRQAAHNSVLATVSANLEKRARFYFSTVEDQLGDDWITVEERVSGFVRDHNAIAAADLTYKHIIDTGVAVDRILFSGTSVSPPTN